MKYFIYSLSYSLAVTLVVGCGLGGLSGNHSTNAGFQNPSGGSGSGSGSGGGTGSGSGTSSGGGSSTGGGSSGGGTATSTGPQTIVFTIPAGTGPGDPWNTAAAPLNVHVGDTVQFVNMASIAMETHTSGTPWPHPTTSIPANGGTMNILVTKTHVDGVDPEVYDHLGNTGGVLHVNASMP